MFGWIMTDEFNILIFSFSYKIFHSSVVPLRDSEMALLINSFRRAINNT